MVKKKNRTKESLIGDICRLDKNVDPQILRKADDDSLAFCLAYIANFVSTWRKTQLQ